MNLDEAREWLSVRLTDLRIAELSGDPERIKHAQDGVENAQDVLCEVTLREEGGWPAPRVTDDFDVPRL